MDSPQRAVLVVDDDADYIELLRTMFAKAQADVVGALSGEQALAAAESLLPDLDLIVLAMRMPGVNGVETARRLRAAGFSGGIVALTAAATMTGSTGKRESVQAGIDAYLSKEALTQELLEALLVRYCRR